MVNDSPHIASHPRMNEIEMVRYQWFKHCCYCAVKTLMMQHIPFGEKLYVVLEVLSSLQQVGVPTRPAYAPVQITIKKVRYIYN